MLEKQIFIIEPEVVFHKDDKPLSTSLPKKRVCAYARVSTDSQDQLNSYNAQITEFTKKIKENKQWEFLGMYADSGISGTSMTKRPEFLKMINDAKTGKIDLILTKSLSRFARNTVDCLTVVRQLRELNVEVFFEKENLYSSDSKIDFILTIFSSIAQEESRNISENVKWGVRKRFKEGKVRLNTSRFLGYDKDIDGQIIINKEQERTVQMIFNMYISGSSLKQVAVFLTENNIANGINKVSWTPSTISLILSNEKYCGDAMLQKRVVLDYLTHKSVVNNGHAPKYYIKNNHAAIIPREKFELTQEIKKKRVSQGSISRHRNRYPLSGLVFCGTCAKGMNRHYYNYKKQNQRIVLSCKNRYRDTSICTNKAVDNDSLKIALNEAIRYLKVNPRGIVDATIDIVKSRLKTADIDKSVIILEEKAKRLETDIIKIVNLSVDEINKDNGFYRSVYLEKKELLSSILDELNKKKSLRLDNHLHNQRIKEMREFLKNYTPFNRNILLSVFKAIIAISQNEVIFVISQAELSKKDVRDNLEIFKSLTPIYSNKIVTDTKKKFLSYRIVRIDVK